MDEERLNEKITPETSGEPVPAETGTTPEEEILPETTADEEVYTASPDPDPDPLRRNTKEALIIGAVLGLVIGILMFFIPSRILEEGARLTISVILILLGPRLVQDKYHIDFSKGRFTMAAALILTLIVYIAIGHPIK